MEIAVSSTSFLEDMLAYAASRLAVGRIVLLWLILSAYASGVSREISTASAIWSALLAAILIAQFRLWDDLADRKYDAALYPHRVLVVTRHARRFAYLCGFLALPAAVVMGMGFGLDRLIAYGVLLAAISVLYAVAELRRLLRAHLVLLKYPVFIWLCAQNAAPAQWARSGAAVYLALCIFEIASDVDLRRNVVWRGVVVIEAAALALLFII